ncbi:acyltransferase family protein [Plantactinospora soyae]|uniref:Peptidoglycan/LPS O-acetylase OafA/YrhL n=1 Tax=Plantactinospora soyae TaxID=1544732 RepID=A0A927RBV4_9ACTN|nr:acyltransferase [Plantactinospora soyae]MBE1492061.1 peptidoglycan/LPS O-acetylase OafA/YrhL [Plantactinospora soyae]
MSTIERQPAISTGQRATAEDRQHGRDDAGRDRDGAGRDRDGAGRDRGIDGLRAYAIGGVVLGHWLVTALVLLPGGALRPASPLIAMPGLVPATWLLETLGLFFFVSGYGSARSLRSATDRGLGSTDWLRRRLGRLLRPVLLLLGGWLVALALAAALGTPAATLRTAATLVISPLWFLLPLVVLIALTGPLSRALHRYGAMRLSAVAVALVALGDLAGRNLSDTRDWPVPLPGDGSWRVPVAVLAAWLVPYLLGMALAGGRLGERRTGWWLLLGGAAGMTALVWYAGYPASAVGVPGAGMSNLDPPSLFAVSLALAQIGVALLIRPALAGWLSRPGRWRPVHRLNGAAMSVYLWHQSTLLGVTALAALVARLVGGGAVPGLHSAPDGPGWVLARLAWLPLLGLVLAVLVGRPARPEPGSTPRAVGADLPRMRRRSG